MARQAKEKIKVLAEARRAGKPDAPARGRLSAPQVEAIRQAMKERTRDRWLCELDNRKDPSKGVSKGAEAFRRGIIPLSTDDYLKLLDWTGRQIRSGKKGAIPAHLAPIQRAPVVGGGGLAAHGRRDGQAVLASGGPVEAIIQAARVAGKRWFKGLASSRAIFGST